MEKGRLRIDFDSLLGKLQTNLQHLSDLVLFSHVASSSVQEAGYNNSSAFFHFQPAQNQKLNFDQAKESFGQWCLATSFEDAIDYLHCFLEECYTVCEILKSGQDNRIKFELFRWIINIGRRRFHKLGLPDKLKHLKGVYQVSSSIEEQILSLNRVRNCLVHRLGIINDQDVDANKILVAKFKQMELLTISPNHDQEIIISGPTRVEAGWRVVVRFNEYKKEFKLGDCINFTEHEHIWAIFTFFWFGQEIKNSICRSFKLVPPESQQPSVDVKLAGIEIDNKTGE